MLNKILQRINKLDKQKKMRIDKQLELQVEIDEIDLKLKRLNAFKKDYEKLQKNFTDFISDGERRNE